MFVFSCVNKNNEPIDFMNDDSNVVIAPQLPDAPRWVSDTEEILNTGIDSIQDLCNLIYEETGHMIMIHTIESYDPYDNLNDYTSALDLLWADDGKKYVIFIISDKLEELRIIHGEATETILPLDFTEMIMNRDMFPEFRNGNYSGGVLNALESYRQILKN